MRPKLKVTRVCLMCFSEGSDMKRCMVAWLMEVLCNLKNVPPMKTDRTLILTVGSMLNLCVYNGRYKRGRKKEEGILTRAY